MKSGRETYDDTVRELKAATHSYAGYCPGCGKMYACAVDYPSGKKRIARFVAGLVRDGARVERVTVETVRTELSSCTCKSEKEKEPSLFAEGTA